ncbi:MAG: UPF0182 family membrane protein [Hyphomicrobiales bacterium]
MFTLSTRMKLILIAIPIGFGMLRLAGWTAEYLWFEALGYASVFWTVRELGVVFFVMAFVAALAYFWINLHIFIRLADLSGIVAAINAQFTGQFGPPFPSSLQSRLAGSARPKTPLVLIGAAVAIAFIFGVYFYNRWDMLLRFWWSQPFGELDPIYGRDIGFYLFELPLFELVQNSLLTASVLTSALVWLGYISAGDFPSDWRRMLDARAAVLWHVLANPVVYLLALAWGFYLDRYELLQSTRGIVNGMGYTDHLVVLPAIWIVLGATLAFATMLLITPLHRRRMYLLVALIGYPAVLVLGLSVVPGFVQGYVVEPNELELEKPYLRHHIALTRKAFQLNDVDERSYEASKNLTPAVLSQNQQTIDNIRVWDWRPLSQTLRQLQQIRTYYQFGDVDVDRYEFGGEYRQVMLTARELSGTLPGKAETWLNRRLQYTHGYGLAMSLASEKTREGSPVLMVKDVPPHSEGGHTVERPEIYYGENIPGHRLVATAVREFDHPKGDQNVYTSYGGTGGVTVDTFWRRLLFAWHRSDVNIAITSYITPQSRLQFWRDVKDRVGRIAPFLLLDQDPYLVLSKGRLYWIQDAYSISSQFPYSEPYKAEFNYIRNSVKAVIDAYNGDVTFYVIDSNDPVLAVYRAALPVLFRNLAEMPEDLRRHLRYPQDLFEAQVAKYSTFHMTVPQVFYNGEDLWAAPREKYGGRIIEMKPYYVLIRLPGETELQFLLMTPLTPANRDNMIAWMAARSDLPDYGQLLVYKLPKERLILGPIQVEATIDQDTIISQQLSLWDQRGSRVIRGSLLVIPIDQSFIYVEPVYLIAENSAIPQLKRVIVSDGEKLAMEPTLRKSLNVVFGIDAERPPTAPSREQSDALGEAREALKTAEEALRTGDWSLFGRAMQQLKEFLGE